MNTKVAKKLAAIAVSMVMATGVVGIANVSRTFRGATASAETEVTEDAASIGVGVDNQATDVHVTNTESATLAITEVPAGRYFLTIAVTQSLGDFSYIVSAQIDDGEPFDLRNDYYNGTLVGVVDIASGAQNVTLSVRPMYTEGSEGVDLTLNAYFAPYAIDGTHYVTGIPVSSSSPAVLALNNLAAGKYILNVSVAEQTGELPVVLNAQLNSGSATPLEYTLGAGAYTAVLDVTEASTSLTLSSTGTNSYIVDVHFVPYELSETNGLYLAGVRVVAGADAAIPLHNVTAANYLVTVDLGGTDIITGNVSLSATVNGGASVLLERDENYENAYTGSVTLTESSTTLTISTTYASTLIVTVSMVEEVVIAPLPIDTETTLNLYDTVTYSYHNDVEGYYSIAVEKVSEPLAGYDVALKTDVESFDSVEIHGNNFPIYLEADTTYYYQITYTGIPEAEESPETSTVKFTVNSWKNNKITAEDYYYVPVTVANTEDAENEEHVELSFEDTVSGAYTLSLIDIPMYMRFSGSKVFMHYGTQTIELNTENNYSADITIGDSKTFYLTTDYGARVTLGLIITPASEEPDTLNLFTANSVTLAQGETKSYFVENIGAGVYSVSLSGMTTASIEVNSNTSDEPIISVGGTSGSFNFVFSGDLAVSTAELLFTNNGEGSQTFTVTVTPQNTAVAGTEQTLNLRVNYAYSNYMELAAGAYRVALGNVPEGKEVRVYANGTRVQLDAENNGVFAVPQAGQVCLTYLYYDEAAEYGSTETITVTANVTAVNTLFAGANTVTLSAEENSKTYYLVGEAGTYMFYLTSTNVSIKNGEQTVVDYGVGSGTLTIAPVEGQTYFAIPLDILYNGDSQVNVVINIIKIA